jgi:hypothetical protein
MIRIRRENKASMKAIKTKEMIRKVKKNKWCFLTGNLKFKWKNVIKSAKPS